jgi:hypothetical protein
MTGLFDELRDARAVLLAVEGLRGSRCRDCGTGLCGHELLFVIVTGFQGDPRCPKCLAAELVSPEELLDARVREFIDHRDSMREAWQEVSRLEPGCPRERPAPR